MDLAAIVDETVIRSEINLDVNNRVFVNIDLTPWRVMKMVVKTIFLGL